MAMKLREHDPHRQRIGRERPVYVAQSGEGINAMCVYHRSPYGSGGKIGPITLLDQWHE
jgi:hypothetical protein